MKKIPTVFERDPEGRRLLLPSVTKGCEWVLAGEGIATRKYNGTCVMFDGKRWWARREVKANKPFPPNYLSVEQDRNTGKTVGFEPIIQSSFAKWHAQALQHLLEYVAGTYELCGPKINGNPEQYATHILIRHVTAEVLTSPPRNFCGLAAWLADTKFEGIVWHHPDGRMAKIKKRDFLQGENKNVH